MYLNGQKCSTNSLQEKLIIPTPPLSDKINQTDPNLLLSLCKKHYNYQFANDTIILCADCGAKPKLGKRFVHHCPDYNLISDHLSAITGSSTEIKKDDCLCFRSYKTHLSIIKSLSQKPQFYDSTLKHEIEEWENIAKSSTDSILCAILQTVCNMLLKNTALLLPVACKIFLEFYGVNIGDCNIDRLNTRDSR